MGAQFASIFKYVLCSVRFDDPESDAPKTHIKTHKINYQ